MKQELPKNFCLLRPWIISLCLILCASSATSLLFAVDTPALTWTERSDWINVKTDVTPAAVGDGLANDTAAIQAALDLAKGSGATQKTVYLPPGTYKITATLSWGNCSGVAMYGCGRNTTIQWFGTSGGTMFWSNGASRARYTGISWDGRNIAGVACFHNSTTLYESRIRHDHEKFINFTSAGIRSYGGGSTPYNATAETSIWNCLFSNCAKGVWNGSDLYNSYCWVLDGCEFVDCGTGLYNLYGWALLLNSHFERSTAQDIYCTGALPVWVRRCSSNASRQFYVTTAASGAAGFVIQDCRIGAWTLNPAVNFATNGTAMVFDCEFSSPPNTTPPISLVASTGTTAVLVHSNNSFSGSSALYSTSGTCQVYSVPDGNTDTLLPSNPSYSFLKQTMPSEGVILDVKGSPYNAVGNNIADDTSAIQNAINDARIADNGKIVYIPVGAYKITSTLNVYGGNYTIQGVGFCSSRFMWAGSATGSLMAVTDPQNIRLEQLELNTAPTASAVRQTGTASSSIVYDGVYNPSGGGYNLTGRGVELVDLPAGSKVFLQHLDSALTVDDCGRADILGKFVMQGRWIIKGADYPKIGFLGVHHSQYGNDINSAGYWDMLVQDNQDVVIGQAYTEGFYRHVRLERGLATKSGRVTIQGFKQHSGSSPEFLNIDNYKGRVMYGPQSSQSNLQNTVTHAGANAMDLIMLGLTFNYAQDILPAVTTDTGANRITLSCLNLNNSVYPASRTYMTVQQPAGWDSSVASALDHLRDLGNRDLLANYGEGILNGARAEWRLDEASWNGTPNQVADSSGYGLHGTASGGATTSADAHAGRAGQFDGVDDKVITTYSATGLTGITIAAWVKRTGDGSADYRTIVGSNTDQYFKMWVNGGKLQLALGNYTQGSGAIRDAGVVPLGSWTHVAVTWSESKGFAAYINGVLTSTVGTSISSVNWPSMTIGKDILSASGWVGLIDHVSVWTSALTPAEIAAIP